MGASLWSSVNFFTNQFNESDHFSQADGGAKRHVASPQMVKNASDVEKRVTLFFPFERDDIFPSALTGVEGRGVKRFFNATFKWR